MTAHVPPAFRRRAAVRASNFVGDARFAGDQPDGFYQGYGILAAKDQRCAPREAAYVTLRHGRVFFEATGSGVLSGPAGPGDRLRILDLAHGPAKLVGTFGDAVFIGSLSRSRCVYDYDLMKVSRVSGAPRSGVLSPANLRPDAGAELRSSFAAQEHQGAGYLRPGHGKAAGRGTRRLVTAAQEAARGDALLDEGKVAEARRFFERAALAGNAEGAFGLGRTYDPEVLSRINGRHPEADALVSRIWYRRAESLGSKTAVDQLARLVAAKPAGE